MSKTKALKILNPILALLFLSQACTGLLHSSIYYKVYDVVHGGGGIALIVAGLLHIYLNWAWVRSNFFKRKAGAG